MFVPSESRYTQGYRSRSRNTLLLMAVKVASGPSFLNFSCTRWTIATASFRVPNSAADTDGTGVATNEAPRIKAARRSGARRMDPPLILTVQDIGGNEGLISKQPATILYVEQAMRRQWDGAAVFVEICV